VTSIYNLSWNTTSFWAKLELFFKSRQEARWWRSHGTSEVQAKGYSALSSTYYSIASTARAQLNVALKPSLLMLVRIPLWCLTWLPLGGWCYVRMLPLSRSVVRLVTYYGMSADMCDIHQSILYRRGRLGEAVDCINVALAKGEDVKVADHTLGLLHVAKAYIYMYWAIRDEAKESMDRALIYAEWAEDGEPLQASRIYRKCAVVAGWWGDLTLKNSCNSKAREFASRGGAEDQYLKQQA
jgi:hypothetical protein